jgi:hypothetical protein
MPPLSHLNSCAPHKSTLFVANFLATVERNPDLFRILTFHVLNLKSHSTGCVVPEDQSKSKAMGNVS